MCYIVPWLLSPHEVSRIDQCDVARNVLLGRLLFPNVIEMVVVLGIIYIVSYGSMLVI